MASYGWFVFTFTAMKCVYEKFVIFFFCSIIGRPGFCLLNLLRKFPCIRGLGPEINKKIYVRWFRRFLDFKVSRYYEGYSFWSILPCWLSQSSWDSQQGWLRTTSILVRAFWNFKRKDLKYSKNCSLHNILIPWSLKNAWIT